MLAENKFSTPERQSRAGKYLLYAIGEIILVVIGILIAVQINDWNTERLNRYKELDYLSEIKVNMMTDKLAIQRILEFNNAKTAAIDSVLTLFSNASSSEDYMPKLVMHMNQLAQYELFTPVTTSFDNMISSTKIDIIKDRDLRKRISEYYNAIGIENTTQEGTKLNTRNFAGDITPKLIGDTNVQQFGNFNIEFDDNHDINVHKDRTVVANLFLMKVNIQTQNLEIKNTDQQIDGIIKLLDQKLK